MHLLAPDQIEARLSAAAADWRGWAGGGVGPRVEAMRRLARSLGVRPDGFTARLCWGEVPAIELAVEGEGLPMPSALASAFDQALREVNVEYDDKRGSDRLGLPRVRALAAGSYAAWRARRVEEGAPEGQVKDPLIAVDEAEWARVVQALPGARR
jgi:hypothetical protein